MPAGTVLIDQINAFAPQDGSCAYWWLGQHSFILKTVDAVIYIDPFLSPHRKRLVESPLAPEQCRNADIVLGSHDHTDHIDREVWPALSNASPNAVFVVPELLRDSLAQDTGISADRILGLNDNAAVELSTTRITGVAAAHETLDRDPDSGRYPYLGFIIESGGCTIYHSGDTCPYDELQSKLSAWDFDIMFLPINGRDAERFAANCMGNMNYKEAADLAGALAPRLAVPAHFGMFDFNTEDPQRFVDYCAQELPALVVNVPKLGECAVFQRR